MGLFLGAVLVSIQLFFGHLADDYVHKYQPAKFAAIETRWRDEQPAAEVLIAIPDQRSEPHSAAAGAAGSGKSKAAAKTGAAP